MSILRLRGLGRGLRLSPRRSRRAGGPAGDTEAPSVPANLVATAVSSARIDLSWEDSTDNVAVTGYKIHRDGLLVDTSPTNAYSDTGLAPGTEHEYEVSAFDAASNESARSAPDAATTHQVIVTAGLVAEWRFDDGAGQVLTDYSGNGRHGQLGSTTGADAADPAWTAQGLSFDGGDRVVIPTLANTISGIDIVLKPTAAVTTTSSAMALLATQSGNRGVHIGKTSELPSTRSIYVLAPSANVAAADTISAAWHLLQCTFRDSDPNDWIFALDGTPLTTTAFSLPADPLPAQAYIIGRGSGNFWHYNGSIAYVVLYSTSRTNQQIEQNREALKTILAARGITLP